jgi:hypothetical protein
MADIPKEDAGLGSGIVNVSQQMAAAIGLAVLGTLATNHTKSLVASGESLQRALTSGYELAFVIAAACVMTGLVSALVILRPSKMPPEGDHTASDEEFKEFEAHAL